jgi:uncharacterized membrane protein HdeD (DUF308 family)
MLREFKYLIFEDHYRQEEIHVMKAKPKDSAVLLRLGLMCLLVGIIAVAVSPFAPQTQLFVAFLSLGMFTLGLGVGCLIFSLRMNRLEKKTTPPPPPPP